MNITVRLIKNKDYNAVLKVDILIQKQYLGEKFDEMNEDEKEKHLVSRKSEFKINVDTGHCFVAEDNKKIVGFLLAYERSASLLVFFARVKRSAIFLPELL